MRIFTIGLGTRDGELLRVRDDKGVEDFVKDEQGNVVKSHLNEELLQAIATEAKGFYLNLRGAGTMNTLYEQGLAPLPKREFSAKLIKRFHEKYYWPLGIAVVLLVLEMFFPERSRKTAAARRSVFHLEPDAAKTAALLALCVFASPALASESTAHRAYEAGRFDAAAREYEALAAKRPKVPRLNYNAGAAAHRAGQLDAAANLLQRAMTSTDRELQERALYNLGNTRFRQGEQAEKLEEKRPFWEEAVKAYETALKMNPADADAKFNQQFVQKKLEELKQQEQQQPKQDQQKQEDQKDKQDQQKPDQPNSQNQQQKNDQPKQDQKDQQQAKGGEKSQEQKDKEAAQQQQDQKKDSGEPRPKDGGQDQQRAQAKNQSGKPEDQKSGEASAAQTVPGQMTAQQAQQLLEAHKDEERTFVFGPMTKTNASGKILKNW
jgi:Ca-activated chloride channel family protein